MKNFVRDGKHIPVIAPKDVKSGEGLMLGELFGVCVHSAEKGQRVTLSTEGVYRLDKDLSVAINTGEGAYYNSETGKVTSASKELVTVLEDGSEDNANPREVERPNLKIGVFIRDEIISSKECEVKLK